MDQDPTSSATTAMPAGGGTAANGAGHAHDAPEGGHTDLMRRVVQSAHATIDRLADTAAPHVQRLQQSMSGTQDSLQSRADQYRETGDEWVESLRLTVKEHPLAAVGMALAAGLLIARITR